MANMELITSVTVGSGGAASVTLPGTGTIPQTYTDLKLVISARGNTAQMSFNGTGGTAYSFIRLMGVGSGTPSSGANSGISQFEGFDWNYTTYTANTFSSTEVYIPNYAVSGINKSISLDNTQENNATQAYAQLYAGLFSNTSPITSITLTSSGGNFVEGSTFYLYGISAVTSTPKATGGIVSQDATHWYHTFPFTSTFTPTQNITCDYLVIAGGGSSGFGNAGGGGAGGLRSTVTATGGGGTLESAVSLTSSTAYTVTVGAGGARQTTGGNRGNNGSDSSIAGTGLTTITSTGGGGSGSYETNQKSGANGGSGGGGGSFSSRSGSEAGGTGITGSQGYGGGNGNSASFDFAGGSGGGAGAAGVNASSTSAGRTGGNGVAIPAIANATFTGVNTFYAGGGGGGADSTPGAGGLGGGGTSGTTSIDGTNGIVNTGGGGGGQRVASGSAALGGSGLVVIRYAK